MPGYTAHIPVLLQRNTTCDAAQGIPRLGTVAQPVMKDKERGDTGMQLRMTRRLSIAGAILLAIALMASLLALQIVAKTPQPAHAAAPETPLCTARPQLCTETAEPWNSAGQYTGHDEPSLLFYSNQPGSGNNVVSLLTLPTDPAAPPSQDGTGSTWGFQLHPAFWYGMIMCDDQAAPNPGAACAPDSDSNLHTSL